MKSPIRAVVGLCLMMGLSANAYAYPEYSPNDFGGIGLLQTPTARFSDDGEFRAGVSTVYPYNQLMAGVQLLPWLETELRYVDVTNRLYGPVDFSGQQSYKDRGVDLKARLLTEGEYSPEVALGIMDVGGTGLFASEYLVASRRYFDFDFSLGMGWGRLGARGDFANPLTSLSSSFKDRPPSEIGSFDPGRFFSGERVSLFGGLQWTPIRSLSFKLEYDGNDYKSEPLGDNQKVHFPLNAAVNWRVWDAVDLSAGVERGDTLMLRFSSFTNFNRNHGPPKVLDPPPTPAYAPAKADQEQAQATAKLDTNFAERLRAELARQNITLIALDVDEDKRLIRIWIAQSLSNDQHRAIGRVAQTLAVLAPPRYAAFTVANVSGEQETYRVTLTRQEIQDTIDFRGSPEELRATTLVETPDPAGFGNAEFKDFVKFPAYDWGMGPALRQYVGGPDQFYFGQVWWRVNGNIDLTREWSVAASVGANIYNNFDGLTVRNLSSLPHVRSDLPEYLKEGKNNLVKLETNYIWSPAPNWQTRLSAGIFEEMYGGVGGEVLYAQPYAPWAIGLNANWVRKRDFDQRLDFLDYKVVTGNLTGYFDLPYNLHINVSVGRYLAKDYGGTFELLRKFDSGVVVGAFATKTDVSAAEFGEGRFDKGFFIYLPLDIFFTRSTRRGAPLVFRPLTRDGGQKVRDGISLYDGFKAGSFDPDSSWVDVLK